MHALCRLHHVCCHHHSPKILLYPGFHAPLSAHGEKDSVLFIVKELCIPLCFMGRAQRSAALAPLQFESEHYLQQEETVSMFTILNLLLSFAVQPCWIVMIVGQAF